METFSEQFPFLLKQSHQVVQYQSNRLISFIFDGFKIAFKVFSIIKIRLSTLLVIKLNNLIN